MQDLKLYDNLYAIIKIKTIYNFAKFSENSNIFAKVNKCKMNIVYVFIDPDLTLTMFFTPLYDS